MLNLDTNGVVVTLVVGCAPGRPGLGGLSPHHEEVVERPLPRVPPPHHGPVGSAHGPCAVGAEQRVPEGRRRG